MDEYESGRYVYRGANPDNYIKFNDELWRIIAVEADGTLKIIRDASIGQMAWDERTDSTSGPRLNSNNTYCRVYSSGYYHGCNAWGKVNGSITIGNYSGTVSDDATLNQYLNGSYYEQLNMSAKSQITNTHEYDGGAISNPDETMQYDILTLQQEKRKIIWSNNKIGLVSISDVLKASTNPACDSLYAARAGGGAQCNIDNYMQSTAYANTWTINPFISLSVLSTFADVWVFATAGVNGLGGTGINADSDVLQYAARSRNVTPVTYLTKSLEIASGTGTSPDPYVVRLMGETDVKVSVNSALALSLDTNDLVLEPVPNGEAAKEDVVVSVSTNDVVGYRLVMSVVEDSNDTSLNYINTNDNLSIPSTTNTGELVANAWGYGLGEASATTSFKPIPAFLSPDTLKTTSGLALNDTTAVTFGVRVDMDIPAGTYRNTISFTVIANL